MRESMLQVRIRVTLLVACASTAAGGCLTASDPIDFGYAPLFGMIYDADNEPVAGARVTVNGERAFTSGVMGRVVIPELPRGIHSISVSKPGFETVETEVEFLTRTHVLYVRMVSFDHLLAQAEGDLAGGRFDLVEAHLSRATRLDRSDPRGRYLRALIAYRRGRGRESVEILRQLIGDGHGGAYVFLLLADAQEFLLNNEEAAAEALAEYLTFRDDPNAGERLERLRGHGGDRG